MSEEIKEQDLLAAENEAPEDTAPVAEQTVEFAEEAAPVAEETAEITEETTPAAEETAEVVIEETAKPKPNKKKLAIIAAAAVVVIVIAIILMVPSKFKRVRNECVQIAGRITGSGDYFMIDTYPDEYENMDDMMVALLAPGAQEDALEAIKYANEELGFNGSVYSKMMQTSALMGRQSEETNKYKVSWTYHPNDGLEVTYEKK